MIRVAIVADSAVIRAGLETMLSRTGRFAVLESPSSGDTGEVQDVDVFVVVGFDTERPPTVGGGVTAFVVLGDETESAVTARLLRDGVRAVLPRTASAEQIEAAVAAAAAGLVALPADLVTATVSVTAELSADAQPLTPREAEVLNLIARGLGNKAVAARLAISEHTVKSHVESIFEKFGVSSRAEAVARGMQLGTVLV